jgi:hypothetical protein
MQDFVTYVVFWAAQRSQNVAPNGHFKTRFWYSHFFIFCVHHIFFDKGVHHI